MSENPYLAALKALVAVEPTSDVCPYCSGHFVAVGGFMHDEECVWQRAADLVEESNAQKDAAL